MISEKELNDLLEKSPKERVTKDYITSRISEVSFTRIGVTMTHCTIKIDNGFLLTGESSCVNEENYNKEIGEKIAYENAFSKAWIVFGFLLAEKNFLTAKGN